MRILHTESSCGWGGQELRVVADICASIRRGHSVTLCCDVHSQFVERTDLPDSVIMRTSIARKSLRGLLALHHVMERVDPDIVVTHSSTDSWLAAIIIRLMYPEVAMIRVRHVDSPIPRNWFTRWLYRQSRMIVTTSEAIRQSVHQATHVALETVIAIPTGVDIEKFRPASRHQRQMARRSLGVNSDRIVVVMIATLRSWKGHRFVIQALMNCPDMDLMIAGDGPQATALSELVDHLALHDRVTFLGFQRNVTGILHAADIFIQPSTGNEGVSQSLLQAMATGLACIVSAIGRLDEVVNDGDNGVLVSPGSVEAIEGALCQLAESPALRQQLAQRARICAVEQFSLTQMERAMDAIQTRVSPA